MFIAQVMRAIVESNGKIWVRPGYVQGDILMEFLSGHKHSALVSKIADAIAYCQGPDEASFPLGRLGSGVVCGEALCRSSNSGLFDIGQIRTVLSGLLSTYNGNLTEIADDYLFFFIRHDADVPVGIGFSMPMLPFLLRRIPVKKSAGVKFLYSAIENAALDIYVNSTEDCENCNFESIGIEIG